MRKLKSKWITKNSKSRLYSIPVPIIGLTGGIATGKSTVAELFRKENIHVIDADKLVKSIYSKKESLQFIQQHFPQAIVEGGINFKTLREFVFKNTIHQELIENFIYAQMPKEFTKAYLAFPSSEFIVYDVPLLFEKKIHEKIDVSICTYSPRAIQLDRLITRDQISEELAQTIISRQMDIEEKKKSSDLVIENMTTLEELKINFHRILDVLTGTD